MVYAFLSYMATKDSAPETTPSVKDYSLDVPMINLEEIVKFVKKIREDGLETASLKAVAKKFDYAAATSTPFYRRMVAARLFGFLPKTGVELNARATAYLKPDDEDSRVNALTEAIQGVPVYGENVQKLGGKKLNLELISNGFETKLKITNAAAKICAKVFEESLRFAGFLDSDGVVQTRPALLPPKPLAKGDPNPHDENSLKKDNAKQIETQTHTLYLDKDKSRKFIVTSPLDLNATELTRITGWLKFTLLVEQPAEVSKKVESPT